MWYDGLADQIDRVNISIVTMAAARGATVANYVKAKNWLIDQHHIKGVLVEDELSAASFEIRAKVVINAAGFWEEPSKKSSGTKWIKAYNLVVKRTWFGPYATAVEGNVDFVDADALLKRGKRNLFFVPWRDGTMIGTQYRPYSGDSDNLIVSDEEKKAFVDEVNAIFPEAQLALSDICFAHVGLLPADPRDTNQPAKHSEILNHPTLNNLITIKGVKYTTGLEVGAQAASVAAKKLGRPGSNRFVFDRADFAALKFDAVADLKTRIIQSIRQEWACRLSDIMFRRLEVGNFEFPGIDVVRTCADIMAKELNWSDQQKNIEIDDVLKKSGKNV